jgi:hypothetical protein
MNSAGNSLRQLFFPIVSPLLFPPENLTNRLHIDREYLNGWEGKNHWHYHGRLRYK